MWNTYMLLEVKWANFESFWKYNKMANQNMQYVQGPKMDWNWRCRLTPVVQRLRRRRQSSYLNTVLSHIRNQETKLKFVSLRAGKEARTYLNMVDEDKKDSLKTMHDTLKDWTNPKSDEIAAFTQLRARNQGNKTLSTYIQEVRRIVDLCNFTCVGDSKDRLTRNSIMAGLSSAKAYQQCISKGSSLALSEYQNLPNRGCHTQTGSSPMSRVYRFYR